MKFEAIVIGSGQAGNPLAEGLADQGWRVALIERAELGGTCINYGCTPSKTMIASAQVAHYAKEGGRWGVQTGEVRIDLPSIVARKNAVVKQFRSEIQGQVDSRDTLHLFRGHAQFIGPHQVRVGEAVLESERIFINAGARPAIPHLDGLETVDYLTNRTIMELKQAPDHLIVLGGGYIGLELGQMFRRFGSRVTILQRGEQVLAREDADVAAELQKALTAEGIQIVLHARTTRAEKKGGQITVTVETPAGIRAVSGSHLLVASGRRPNSDDLGLESAGIQADERGFIKVNDRLETNIPGIWALGDVKGGPAFTHISYNDYEIIYANLIEKKGLSTEGRIVPYAVYTDPELGRVGLTENEARAAGWKLKIGKVPLAWVARAIERDETTGLMKLVVDAESNRILGAAILAPEGAEVVHILETLMVAQAPYTLLERVMFIHPTLAEGLFSLLENVQPEGREAG